MYIFPYFSNMYTISKTRPVTFTSTYNRKLRVFCLTKHNHGGLYRDLGLLIFRAGQFLPKWHKSGDSKFLINATPKCVKDRGIFSIALQNKMKEDLVKSCQNSRNLGVAKVLINATPPCVIYQGIFSKSLTIPVV